MLRCKSLGMFAVNSYSRLAPAVLCLAVETFMLGGEQHGYTFQPHQATPEAVLRLEKIMRYV
jgi:hypothetical protein